MRGCGGGKKVAARCHVNEHLLLAEHFCCYVTQSSWFWTPPHLFEAVTCHISWTVGQNTTVTLCMSQYNVLWPFWRLFAKPSIFFFFRIQTCSYRSGILLPVPPCGKRDNWIGLEPGGHIHFLWQKVLWKVHDQIVPTHRVHWEYEITSKVYLTPESSACVI